METTGQTEQLTTETNNQTNNQSSVSYEYADLVGANVQAVKPKAKSFQSQDGKPGSYAECPLLYNYGTPECPIVDAWLTQLCEVKCKGGIQYKAEKKPSRKAGEKDYVKETYSLMFIFDPQNPETQPCLDKMEEGYKGLARAIDPYKGDLNLGRNYDPNNAEQVLPSPVYYKINPLTNEKTGQSPTMWVTLNHWPNNRTLFTMPCPDDPKGKPVDWKLLYNVEMSLIPLVQWHHVYSGTTKSIKMHLVGAIITDIVEMAKNSKQTSTMDKLLAKNKGLADKVSAQLAGIQMNKQDELDDVTPQARSATLPGEEGGQMFKANSNRQGDQDGLRDFLGGVKAPSTGNVTNSQGGQQVNNPLPTNQGWAPNGNQDWQQNNYQGQQHPPGQHSVGQQTPGQFQNIPQNIQNSNNDFSQYSGNQYPVQNHPQGHPQFTLSQNPAQNPSTGASVQVQLPVQGQGAAHVQLPTQLPPQVQAQMYPQGQFQQRPVIQLTPGGQQATMRLE